MPVHEESQFERIGQSRRSEEAPMPKIIAAVIELLVSVCAMWLLVFLSTFHALGYMLAAGDGHWHIRVGW